MVDAPPASRHRRRCSARVLWRANDEAGDVVEKQQSSFAALSENVSCQLLGPRGKMVATARLVKSTTHFHGIQVDPDCVLVYREYREGPPFPLSFAESLLLAWSPTQSVAHGGPCWCGGCMVALLFEG